MSKLLKRCSWRAVTSWLRLVFVQQYLLPLLVFHKPYTLEFALAFSPTLKGTTVKYSDQRPLPLGFFVNPVLCSGVARDRDSWQV